MFEILELLHYAEAYSLMRTGNKYIILYLSNIDYQIKEIEKCFSRKFDVDISLGIINRLSNEGFVTHIYNTIKITELGEKEYQRILVLKINRDKKLEQILN
jgi:hypothetical protein